MYSVYKDHNSIVVECAALLLYSSNSSRFVVVQFIGRVHVNHLVCYLLSFCSVPIGNCYEVSVLNDA